MAVNVIGFTYSALQAYDIVKYLSTGRHIIRHHLRHYLDFSMDQASHCFGLIIAEDIILCKLLHLIFLDPCFGAHIESRQLYIDERVL
jgi:hypothetical protein